MKKFILLIFFFGQTLIYSQNELQISREFGLFTSKNLSGYLKPLTTTINQSLNANYFTVMNFNNGWSFGLDLSACGTLIPNSQKTFDAELPGKFGNTDVVWTAEYADNQYYYDQKGTVKEPTIYGGISHPVFAAPQNAFPPDSFYKTVAYAEGNNIAFMSGLPAIQLFLGVPTRTQLRFRFLTAPVNNSSLTYFGIGINQNIDKMFGIFDNLASPYAIGVNLMYSSIKRNPGIDISSFALGATFSARYESGFGYYSGLQYQDMSGSITAIRKTGSTGEFVNNPYEEVRNGAPLVISTETFTNMKAFLGGSYKIGIVELHCDVALASQPEINAGLSFTFFDTGESLDVFEPINVPNLTNDTLPVLARFDAPQLKEIEPAKLFKQTYPIKSDFQLLTSAGKPLDTIKIKIYRSRQLRAFLPFIFFDDNSANIPSKYIQSTTEQVHNFSIRDLMGKSSLDSYYYLLNILGKRLSDIPDASLTLTGCNSNTGKEKNNKKLSQLRADNVKKYLTDVWQIAPNRIKVVARNLPEKFSNPKDPDGIVENRRVEISSDKWDIIAPIIIEDTLRVIEPDGIIVKNDIFSETPLKNWEFNVSSNNERVINLNGKGTPGESLKIDLSKNDSLKAKLSNNLTAFLKIENADEVGSSDLKKVPVSISVQDSSINVYNLILFDFNRSDLGKSNMKIADLINNDLSDEANVKVVGHTDRIGDDKHNKKLSDSRAKSTAATLKAKNIESEGLGEDDLLYDNSTPEGRFYCRTVQVLVRQKNKDK